MQVHLKCCPFCGSNDITYDCLGKYEVEAVVYCNAGNNCTASQRSPLLEDAIALWNTRVPSA